MSNPKLFDLMVKQLTNQVTRGDHLISQLPRTLRAVLGENEWHMPMWRQRIDMDTGEAYVFDRFEDFVEATPTAGIGATMGLLKDVCRSDPVALDMLDQAVQRPKGGSLPMAERVNSLNQEIDIAQTNRAMGSDELRRRLRKDRPDLHAKVLAGEMTVTKAAVTAGFYPDRRAISLVSAKSAAATIRKHAAPEFIEELRRLLSE